MKKERIFVTLSMLILIIAGSISVAPFSYVDALTANNDDLRLPNSQNEPCTAPWVDLYSEILEDALINWDGYLGGCSYSIYDIDRNGIPELFVKTGACEAVYLFHIYTISNGQAKEIAMISGSHSSICGITNRNGFLLQFGQMGYEIIEAYYGTSDTLPAKGDVLFEGEVEEYHNLTQLEIYALDDYSGLCWSANPTDNNQSVIDNLR